MINDKNSSFGPQVSVKPAPYGYADPKSDKYDTPLFAYQTSAAGWL